MDIFFVIGDVHDPGDSPERHPLGWGAVSCEHDKRQENNYLGSRRELKHKTKEMRIKSSIR